MVVINQKVIKTIVSIAVMENEYVYGFVDQNSKSKVERVISRNPYLKGIDIVKNEKDVVEIISVYLILKYGCQINKESKLIINGIIESIESMIPDAINKDTKININVVGLNVQ